MHALPFLITQDATPACDQVKEGIMETDPNEAAHFRMLFALSDRNVLLSTFNMLNMDVVAWDATTGRIICANASAQQSLSLAPRDIDRKYIHDVIATVPKRRLDRFFSAVKQRAFPEVKTHIPYTTAAGEKRLNRYVLRYVEGPKPTFIGTMQNITRYLDAITAATKAEALMTTAIESLSDGFVLYDADDKLVICNERYRQIYANSAPAMVKGTTFRQILQYGLDRGQYRAAIGREADWLKERMMAHNAANSAVEQNLSTGEWLRIVERRTADGGRVGLPMDITELYSCA